MEEKFNLIENKKEFFTEVSIETGIAYNSLRSNYFYPVRIDKELNPELYSKVAKIINKRIDYQRAVRELQFKYFGK